jgi:hypothetical protein
LVIGGPEAVTWLDVVAAFERELHRELPIRNIPAGSPIPGQSGAVNALAAMLDSYDSPLDMTDLSRIFNVQPTTLAGFAHDLVTGSHAS